MRPTTALPLLLLLAGCAHGRAAAPPPHLDLADRLSGFIWPLPVQRSAEITSDYGGRGRRHHDGLDIDGRTGDPVFAAADGRVRSAGWAGGYGHTVVLDHGRGVTTLYAHNSALHVVAGEPVRRGQVIASVGASGNASGDHLHFEVAWRGFPVDPRPLLPRL